jgi:cephalosporin-C deacetylase-like acetyl esterase
VLRRGRYALCVFFFLTGLSQSALAQGLLRADDLRVIQGTALEKNYRDMLYTFLLGQAAQATEKRLARLEAIQSQSDFQSWQEANRRRFLELIGGLPAERTPLNPRVVGELTREGYVVRKLIFESLPGYYVTANLYVPTAGQAPYPGVLSPCGHSSNGKAYAIYQHLFVGLAERGYVVLTYDPVGQGERYQYWNFVTNRRLFEINEHGMAGIQEYLLGQNFARYRIWDGLRALDYLTSLPEVDATRIGVTGNSGGGTLTTFISMLDPRVKVASIVTYITSISKKIEARSYDAETDPEQDIQGLLAAGIDHTEMVGMIAPRPVLIGAATQDFFPIQGTRQTYGELQQLYRKLGVPERVKMVEFNHRHEYSQPLRESTYAWFDRWLKLTEGEAHEPSITTEKDAALQCTPTGQVITSLGGRRMYDFNREGAERLAASLASARHDPGYVSVMPSKIIGRLALPSTQPQPNARKLADTAIAGAALEVEKLLLESEPGIAVPTRLIYPRQNDRLPAVIYLRDRAGDQDNPGLFAGLAQEGKLVAVADVRGFGETKSPRNVGDVFTYFDSASGMDADFAYAAFFLSRPLLGMRVWDALSVFRYLCSRSDVDPARIFIVGRGWAGPVALFAAAVEARVAGAVVEGIPASYTQIARSEVYTQPVSLLLPGALQDFDLADVMAVLAPRPLLVMDLQDPTTRRMSLGEAEVAVKPARDAYERAKAQDELSVRVEPLEAEISKALEAWIGKR